jgi:ribonucleoside-diphosphate reductase beta chain
MTHPSFLTTSRGLRRESPSMRLYEKAKRLGVWNPTEIDFSQDRRDWQQMTAVEQEVILHLTSLFQGGEEAVTLDLLPLIQVIAAEGRLEEEMFLTTFLFEEAKHTDFFNRFLAQVPGAGHELSRFHTANYRAIFCEALPQALGALRHDPSPLAQVRASVTYNLIVEGVLAETGYHAFFTMLERNDLMPGLRAGIRLLKQDESRHIAYGVFLLSRLLAQDETLWEILDSTMNSLLVPALGVISDIFSSYDPVPFGLVEDDFINFAMDQFGHRFARLERARGASLSEIEQASQEPLDND